MIRMIAALTVLALSPTAPVGDDGSPGFACHQVQSYSANELEVRRTVDAVEIFVGALGWTEQGHRFHTGEAGPTGLAFSLPTGACTFEAPPSMAAHCRGDGPVEAQLIQGARENTVGAVTLHGLRLDAEELGLDAAERAGVTLYPEDVGVLHQSFSAKLGPGRKVRAETDFVHRTPVSNNGTDCTAL